MIVGTELILFLRFSRNARVFERVVVEVVEKVERLRDEKLKKVMRTVG